MICIECATTGITDGAAHKATCPGPDAMAVVRWVLLMFGETPPDEYVQQIAEDGSTLGHAVELARRVSAAPSPPETPAPEGEAPFIGRRITPANFSRAFDAAVRLGRANLESPLSLSLREDLGEVCDFLEGCHPASPASAPRETPAEDLPITRERALLAMRDLYKLAQDWASSANAVGCGVPPEHGKRQLNRCALAIRRVLTAHGFHVDADPVAADPRVGAAEDLERIAAWLKSGNLAAPPEAPASETGRDDADADRFMRALERIVENETVCEQVANSPSTRRLKPCTEEYPTDPGCWCGYCVAHHALAAPSPSEKP